MSDYNLLVPTLALVGSAISTSYVLFANVGCSQMGVISLIRGRLANDVSIPARDKIKIWKAFYNRGMKWFVGVTLLAVVSDAVVITTHPSASVRQLSLASALIGMGIVPFTALAIKPTNKELLTMDEADSLRGVGEDSAIAKRANQLLAKWDRLHLWRHVFYTGAFVLSLSALLLDSKLAAVVEVDVY